MEFWHNVIYYNLFGLEEIWYGKMVIFLKRICVFVNCLENFSNCKRYFKHFSS